MAGDVTASLCGTTGTLPKRVDQFWHCAASLQYEDRYKQEIYATNLTGTLNALELARRLNVSDCFNYVSTAYVAGRRTGLIREQVAEACPNNHYEASKIGAEATVVRTSDFPTRVLRPGVVIGHSRTLGVANSFTGLYGFTRKLVQFKAAMARLQDGLLSREPVQVCVDMNTRVNLVPIDIVARQAVRIALSASREKIFHLTNATPPTVSELLFSIFEECNVKLALVESRKHFSWIDQKFDQGIEFYCSYLVGPKIFDRAHTNGVEENAVESSFGLDSLRLRSYVRWYLNLLAVKRPHLLAHR